MAEVELWRPANAFVMAARRTFDEITVEPVEWNGHPMCWGTDPRFEGCQTPGCFVCSGAMRK